MCADGNIFVRLNEFVKSTKMKSFFLVLLIVVIIQAVNFSDKKYIEIKHLITFHILFVVSTYGSAVPSRLIK